MNSQLNANKLNEKKITVDITPFEMSVIHKIRKVEYGSVEVHITKGIPVKSAIRSMEKVNPLEEEDIMNRLNEKYGNEN